MRYVISIIMGIVLAIWSFKQLSQSHLDSGFIFFFIVYVLCISCFNSDKHDKNKKRVVHEFINVYTIVFIMNVGNAHEFLIYYLILILINLWKMLSISSPGQSIFSSFIQCIKPSINES
ncbi:hypothetical protein U004_00495 [Staphylococcus aureus OCMM6124]|nr:hypothetical protein T736_02246 [Staphylococcus aureus OCMM6048]EVF88276.1 hypothetical protein T852_00495 [Staphylococcus aureus OCMM6057]EVI91403.1 hypothetical protein U004_00495 [Staphylococcus aureus OCMM6124]